MHKTRQALEIVPFVFGADPKEKIKLRCKSVYRIILIGTGSSYHVALWADWFIRSFYSFEVQTFQTWNFLAAPLPVHAEDLVIVISQRGCKGLTQILIQSLKGHKNLLLISAQDRAVEESASHTKSLMAAIANLIDFFNEAFSDRKLHKVIGSQKKEVARILAVLRTVLPGDRHFKMHASYKQRRFHAVGGGPFDAVAAEVALKLKEMAHVTADHYGLEEILHGPIVSLKKEDVVLMFSPRSLSKKPLNRFLYHDRLCDLLKKLEKTKARLIVPVFDRQVDEVLQALHPVFQAIGMLYWGQWFSFKLAESIGVDPDCNPYVS